MLLKEYPMEFAFSVSHTTRPPRLNEQNGFHYWFVTRSEFEQMRADESFVESNEYGGNLYGTSRAAVARVRELGKRCVLDVDINGVLSLKAVRLSPPPRFVFIA